MYFGLSIVTTIISLLWSIQFFATIHSEATVVWLNVLMILTWMTQCAVYIYRQKIIKGPIHLRIPLLKKKLYQKILTSKQSQEHQGPLIETSSNFDTIDSIL